MDLIYNPRRTVLLLQAEMMNIPYCDGLPFLVAQGAEAANHFQGESFGTKELEQILRDMRREKEKLSSSVCLVLEKQQWAEQSVRRWAVLGLMWITS